MNLEFRHLVEGDENGLIDLWNRAHARYVGHFRKTVERWRWTIRQWHDVAPSSIVIAMLAGRMCAYGVLDNDGTVLEFAVEPELEPERKRVVCTGLVEKLEARGRVLRCETLSFMAPAFDRTIAVVLEEAGYAAERLDSFGPGLGILNPALLMGAILAHPDHGLPESWTRRIVIETPPGGYLVSPQSRTLIDVDHGRATVGDASSAVPENVSWRLEVDMTTLTDLIFGLTSFHEAVRKGRLTFAGGCTESDANTLFSALIVKGDWYTPQSDWF